MRIDESGWAYYRVNFLEDEIYQRNKTFHISKDEKTEGIFYISANRMY